MRYAVSFKAILRLGYITPATFEHAVGMVRAKSEKKAIKKAERQLDKTFPDRHYMGKSVVVMEVK